MRPAGRLEVPRDAHGGAGADLDLARTAARWKSDIIHARRNAFDSVRSASRNLPPDGREGALVEIEGDDLFDAE